MLLGIMGISIIYGGVMALVASVVTVPVTVLLFALGLTDGWSAGRIRGLAAVSGGVSGFLCLAVASGFRPEGIAFACVPATFGALVTWAIMEPVARRAERTRRRLLADTLNDSATPATDLEPSPT